MSRFSRGPVRPERGPRRNHQIRVPQVRVVGADGSQLGVMSTDQARALAEESGLDLVEVVENARPPVCKIVDYGKFKYESSKREKERRKNAKVDNIAEIRMRPFTDTHDMNVKLAKAEEYLRAGSKVRIMVRYRGRELRRPEAGEEQMQKAADALKEIGKIDHQGIRFQGRTMVMTLTPLTPSASQA